MNKNDKKISVAIVMGSNSDHPTVKYAEEFLDKFNISYESKVVSAHRTPEAMYDFAKQAVDKYEVIIAAAGGAAHLPGMISSLTTLPVIGIPVKSSTLNGVDSLLSINQMPGGVPVATMSIGKAGAINAAIFATRILAVSNDEVRSRLDDFAQEQIEKVKRMELK